MREREALNSDEGKEREQQVILGLEERDMREEEGEVVPDLWANNERPFQ